MGNIIEIINVFIIFIILMRQRLKMKKKYKNKELVENKESPKVFKYYKNKELVENKKILVLIFSCYKYSSRIDKLKDIGYLDNFSKENINYLIITGNCEIGEQYILEKNKLIINTDDSYKGLPQKVIKTLYIVNNLFNYDYIIKSDDDCLLNILHIKYILNYIKNEDYIGSLILNSAKNYHLEWNGLISKSKYIGGYMDGGRGYVLSKKAINSICNYKEQITKLLIKETFEDKLIGDILRLNGYPINYCSFWDSYYFIMDFTGLNNYEELINKKFTATKCFNHKTKVKLKDCISLSDKGIRKLK